MTLIGKELREIVRDGRVLTAAAVVFVLLAAALVTSAERASAERKRRVDARAAEERVWLGQGERNPHIAAHFGQYAMKPLPPLAAFDPGVTTYTGSAIWIEAHYQNPFAFRPSDDATPLLRFGETSPATLLQVLLPLLIIAIGFPMVAQERERGTLRHVLSLGIDTGRVMRAKVLALTIVVLALLAGAALVSAPFALRSFTGGTAFRAAGLVLAYAAYLAVFVAITIAVSAHAASTRSAISILLAFWIGSTLVVPRVAAEFAAQRHAVPSSAEFWAAVRRDIDTGIDGHNPRNARRKTLEQRLLAQHRVSKVEDLPFNFEGLALEEGERYANQVFDRHYGRLFETWRRRSETQQLFAIASPYLAIRELSMALSGTDAAHHVRFARDAEQYRRELQYFLNHDMTANARNVAFLDYKRGREFWASTPKFEPASLSAADALRDREASLLLLGAWLIAGVFALSFAARALGRAGESRAKRIAERRAAAEAAA
jgi:ABC-2 type transport system permease protein